ncbi:MAG: hypothetical protein Rubg2KO_30430 [Rubricoccaceae bacterium]
MSIHRPLSLASSVLLLALAMLLSPARAQDAPKTIAFQGLLTDATGQPVPDGIYAITVSLYTAEVDGVIRYGEGHTVTTENGLFALAIGTGTYIIGSFSVTEALWVEIEVDGTALSPRTQLHAVPYARTLTAGAVVRSQTPGVPALRARSDTGVGFEGRSEDGTGVWGYASSGVGVSGVSWSETGTGVSGRAGTSAGATYGVRGEASSSTGTGTAGIASSQSGRNTGVYGESTRASQGRGVAGIASSETGATVGLYGEVESPDGYAADLLGGQGLRIRTGPAVTAESALLNEDIRVSSNDAVLGLYSSDVGDWGSAVVLGEMAFFGTLVNKWAVARGTGTSGALHFTFGTDANYSSNDTQMRIDTDGSVHADGSFTGGGADFAEWFPVASSSARPRAGDVVGVTGGRVGLATAGAEQVMIVSSNPAFVGNPDAEETGALVALVGQAEVRITSSKGTNPAQVGDLLVASGQGNGLARAVSPARYDPAKDGPVAGRVLELTGDGTAVALVGVDEAAALREVVISQQTELAAQQRQLDAQQAQIDALMRRLDALDHQPSTPTRHAVPER